MRCCVADAASSWLLCRPASDPDCPWHWTFTPWWCIRTDTSILSESVPSVLALLAGVRFDHTTKLPSLPARGSRRFLLHDHPESIFSPASLAAANPKQKVGGWQPRRCAVA